VTGGSVPRAPPAPLLDVEELELVDVDPELDVEPEELLEALEVPPPVPAPPLEHAPATAPQPRTATVSARDNRMAPVYAS
jgi:hypothetical protein